MTMTDPSRVIVARVIGIVVDSPQVHSDGGQ